MRLYLDSPAPVKLVQREAETEALCRFLRQHIEGCQRRRLWLDAPG